MWKKIRELLDRTESRISLWVYVWSAGSTIVGGGITGWIAWATDWLDSYGAIAWWFAALTGALLTTLVVLGIMLAKYALAKAAAINKWKADTIAVNPIDNEFHKQRIRILDISNPFTGKIYGKKFTDCELLGPAVIYMGNNSNIHLSSMVSCDIVVIKPNIKRLNNAICLENTDIIGGSIYKITILIMHNAVPIFVAGIKGIEFITLTGHAEFDNK